MENLGSGMPSSINSSIMTLEQLEAYIAQQEHPEIIMELNKIKEKMLESKPKSDSEDIDVDSPVETKPKRKKKTTRNKKKTKKDKKENPLIENEIKYIEKPTEQKVANNTDVSVLVNKISNIYSGDFKLPSNKEITVNMRTMTVEEYKFLSKFLEFSGIEGNEKETELEIINSIDTVLQRCITNNIDIRTITIFDWYYLILNLKMMSRGDKDKLTMPCSSKSCDNEITITSDDLSEAILENSESLNKNPISIIDVSEDTSLYIANPNINDIRISEKLALNNNESKIFYVSSSYIKGCITNGTNYILSPEQRNQVFSSLNYDSMNKIISIHQSLEKEFISSCGLDKCPKCGKSTGITCSDFILFFLEF